MTKVGKKSIDRGWGKQRFTPLEDVVNLASLVRVNLASSPIGAYLLRKGEHQFKLIFGFDCQGIHSTLIDEELEPTLRGIEAGLKDLPSGETLTVNLGSFADSIQREQELRDLFEGCSNTELRYLLYAERIRLRELTERGQRKPVFLRLYVTYTVEAFAHQKTDWIEKLLSRGERWWHSFTGQLEERQYRRVEQVLLSAYHDGYQIWHQLLTNGMGLSVRPLSDQELWGHLWKRFNETPPVSIPQLLVLDETGVREEIYSKYHPVTILMQSESSVPIPDRRWIYLNQRYIAPLTFVEKPGGWPDARRQLCYLWSVISRDRIQDTEIVCQLTRGSDTLVKTNMQRLVKQSMTAQERSLQSNSIDVNAQLNLKKSIAAQEEIFEGSIPVHVGVVFLVYRKTRQELDEACRYLESLFLPPAWVLRETEYPWKIWLQCLPLVWDKLLSTPFNRRQLYLSSEVPGLMPLVRTKPTDKMGLELISQEGGNPVYLDLYNQHQNIGFFSTSRGGKSTLVGGVIIQALAHQMPVVIMDYPKPDGSSTFDDLTRFLKDIGAYFDIGSESSNLFEIPDLKGLEGKLQTERFQDYQDFLLSALMAMVVGSKLGGVADPVLTDTIRSVLGLALTAFFTDNQIRNRYARAYVEGIGSTDWQNMPTLVDFISYCSGERLQLELIPGDTQTAIERIKLRLRFWLTSRVGQAISSPSTFRSDSQLLVFALRNLSNDEDAAIISLAAYSAALRRALAASASIFFVDEAPILFQFDSIANLLGKLCANGAKSGIRVLLSAQDPDTIASSSAGAKILQNLTTRLVGRIQPSAVESFVKIFRYPTSLIEKNASPNFFPNPTEGYSQWLLESQGTYTPCRYYPSWQLLAALANNPEEQKARREILERSGNSLVGLTKFSRQIAS
jgi:hypothetical protein